jgi:hypothetical protein
MDNFYQGCPPKMDGRHLGDYQSSTRRNEYIKYINDITRDDQYRLFLQLNGKEIMDREWGYHNKYNRCNATDCVHNYPTRVNNGIFLQERVAYDSIYNLNTNKKYAHLRQCEKFSDYRMSQ